MAEVITFLAIPSNYLFYYYIILIDIIIWYWYYYYYYWLLRKIMNWNCLLNLSGASTGLMPDPIRSTQPPTMDRTHVRSYEVTKHCRIHLPSPFSRITYTGLTGGPIQLFGLINGTAPTLPSFSAHLRNLSTFRLFLWTDRNTDPLDS